MTGIVLVAASSLEVLSLLAFAVSLVALCESGQGQGPECDRGQRALQPSLPNFGVRNSLGFAYDANLGR
jgi:hypothetical protein